MRTADVKDQIELSGNDIQAVSMTGEKWRIVHISLPSESRNGANVRTRS